MSEVSVQILGCGDAFGSGGRLQTCFYVKAGATRFLFDCGTTALISFHKKGISSSDIDVILLTHLHGDHFGGIPIFLLDAQLISKRTRPLIIAGPPSLEGRIRAAQEILYPRSSQIDLSFTLDFEELKVREPTKIDNLVVTAYTVVHPSGAPSYALRVEIAGKVITYSGDTEWTDTLIEASDGADLFICEANYFDKKVKYHLDYRTLMKHSVALRCKQMVLTHMGDEMLKRIDELDVETAADGKVITIL